MTQNAPLPENAPDLPVLELACATWMVFDRFYNEHIVPCRLFVPPSRAPGPGPVLVSVKLPSGEVLWLDAVVGRTFHDARGAAVSVEIRFHPLSHTEKQELSRYAARRERGWSVPPMSRVGPDRAPASGVRRTRGGVTAED